MAMYDSQTFLAHYERGRVHHPRISSECGSVDFHFLTHDPSEPLGWDDRPLPTSVEPLPEMLPYPVENDPNWEPTVRSAAWTENAVSTEYNVWPMSLSKTDPFMRK